MEEGITHSNDLNLQNIGFRDTIRVAEFSLKGVLKYGVVEEREMQTQLM